MFRYSSSIGSISLVATFSLLAIEKRDSSMNSPSNEQYLTTNTFKSSFLDRYGLDEIRPMFK